MLTAILLGILQGLTEFLPISSSGHLVLAQHVMPKISASGLVFDVVLHAGTLVAVIAYFFKDITWIVKGILNKLPGKENVQARTWSFMVVIGTLPAAVIGLLFEERIEKFFENPIYSSFFLCVTGIILFSGEWLGRRSGNLECKESSNSLMKALVVGMAQSLALFPGISRSGSTMAAGLAIGWSREKAARFSFLLMIPAVSGAVILKVPELPALLKTGNMTIPHVVAGSIAAGISGYLSIALLLGIVRKYSFKPFAWYCLCVGIISFVAQKLLVS